MKKSAETFFDIVANLLTIKKSFINIIALKPKKVPARRLISIISDDTANSV